jgi:hypothetical protein
VGSAVALLLPDAEPGTAVPHSTDAAAVERARDDLRSLVGRARQSPPAAESSEETSLLTELALVVAAAVRASGPAVGDLLRTGVNRTMLELVRREFAAAEAERKFALRQIERAVDRFGVLVEAVRGELVTLDADTLVTLISDIERQLHALGGELAARDRVVLRFELDLLVSLEVLDAPLTELTTWAFRLVNSARQVEALSTHDVTTALHGELARARARHSWESWDASDAAVELSAWPAAPR